MTPGSMPTSISQLRAAAASAYGLALAFAHGAFDPPRLATRHKVGRPQSIPSRWINRMTSIATDASNKPVNASAE